MFLKKYPNLCAFRPYFARHRRLIAVLLGAFAPLDSIHEGRKDHLYDCTQAERHECV